MRTATVLALGAFLLSVGCAPDRARLNPFDPESGVEAQVSGYSLACDFWPDQVLTLHFPYGVKVSPSDHGKLWADHIVFSPMPVTQTGGYNDSGWRWDGNSPAKEIRFSPVKFECGETYSIKVTDKLADEHDRPIQVPALTLRMKNGDGGLWTAGVSPASPAAGSRPSFQWTSTDFDRFQITLTRTSFGTHWDSGILHGPASQLQYPVTANALVSGSYQALIRLYGPCTCGSQQTVLFTVP